MRSRFLSCNLDVSKVHATCRAVRPPLCSVALSSALRSVAAAAVLSALTIAPRSASAKQEPLAALQLHYEAPAGCGSEQEVLAKLAAALGPNAAPIAALEAHVSVRNSAARVVLEYRAHKGDVNSERTLTLDTCEVASDAAALLLLLTLDPGLAESLGAEQAVGQIELGEAQREPAGSTATPSAEPPSDAAQVLPPERTRAAPPQQTAPSVNFTKLQPPRPAPAAVDDELHSASFDGPSPWQQGWVALGASAVSALGPRPAFGAGVSGALRVGHFFTGPGLAFAAMPALALSEPPNAQLQLRVLRAHWLVGLELGSAVFRFGPWGAVGAERISAEVSGISAPRPGHTTLLSAAGGAWANAMITDSWGLSLRAAALLALQRPEFKVAGIERAVHQPAPVGGELFLGVLWSWGSQKATAAASTF